MNIVSDFGDGHDRAIFYKCYTTLTFSRWSQEWLEQEHPHLFHHNSPWPIASHRICFHGMPSILPCWTIFFCFKGWFWGVSKYVFIECFFVCFRHIPTVHLVHFSTAREASSLVHVIVVSCAASQDSLVSWMKQRIHTLAENCCCYFSWGDLTTIRWSWKTPQQKFWVLQIQVNICNGGWEVWSVAELALCLHWGGEVFIVWQQWREPCLSCSRHKALETQHETWCNYVGRCFHKCLFRRSWYCYCFRWEDSIGKFHHSFTLAPRPAKIQTTRPQTTTKTHRGE